MPKIWIRNPAFDLLFVILGGAALTLALPAFVSVSPALLPVFFWIWLVGFEGSHFWATFSRTYLDRDFAGRNSVVLAGSLVFFLFPALAAGYRMATGNAWPADLYGYGIFVWSLWHNTRQHYGFLSIYGRKSGIPADVTLGFRRLIYFAIAAAQVFFWFRIKSPLALPGFPKFEEWPGAWQQVLTWGPYLVSMASGVALAWLGWRSWRAGGVRGMLPALYTATCLVFYSVMFYVVAPMEPFYGNPANNAQLIMMVTIMNSLFHNIQYHAIVWHYANRRYAEPVGSGAFGWAGRINRSFGSYALVALAMGAGFGAIVWGMGDWPSIFGSYTAQGGFPALPYVLYFGIVGHHFYLDQKIWRPSRQQDLSGYLGLTAAGAGA